MTDFKWLTKNSHWSTWSRKEALRPQAFADRLGAKAGAA